ncbi:MAG TPA: AMP-binding protein, partial [Syntrophobacteraceae bacterium]|nr:AMP-binding protein [Syntrophobacteraceae bacterium]
SGTTGQKKGIRYSFHQLATHTEKYNSILKLSGRDTIASWLPLYHDMGFIACFIMPLMLGVPVVMMDPMVWVRRPLLLFESIRRYAATVCFMPNFGFEIMSRYPQQGPFASMRKWVSCSETVYPETMKKFGEAVHAVPSTLSACYGMAENVFAICQSSGLELIEAAHGTFVSCGPPVPGTAVKVLDGEIFVRSEHSIHSYEGGSDVLDDEGFYATGDLGFMHRGGLAITGRKVDLANIGGRKFLLNDLDFQLGNVFPESAGRIASLHLYDETIGTEKVIFLIEAERFWEKKEPEFYHTVKDATGLDFFEMHFIPPFFITKTSSGKINRKKTLEDWLATRQTKNSLSGHPDGNALREDLQKLFGSIPLSVPVKDVVDSLGAITLRLLCEDHGVDFDLGSSLEQMLSAQRPQVSDDERAFSILALTDGLKLGIGKPWGWADQDFLERLSMEVGCHVHLEHLIVPPVPILFSDLVFYDYFMPRMQGAERSAISACMEKIKDASLIIVDDEDNYRLLDTSVYPRLNHRFTNAPVSAFLAHRFARYVQKHHLLPKDVVPGSQISRESITPSLADLQAYLGKPIMRLAFLENFRTYTHTWDYKEYRAYRGDDDFIRNPISKGPLQDAIVQFVRAHGEGLPKSSGEQRNMLISKDPQHFCSFLINPMAVQWVVNRYDSFCILGFPWNLPYLEQALKRLDKRYCYATGWNADFEAFDCVIMTGVEGLPKTSKPIFDFVHAMGKPGRPHNVPEELIKECPFFYAGVPEVLKALSIEDLDRLPLGNFLLNGGWFNLVVRSTGLSLK